MAIPQEVKKEQRKIKAIKKRISKVRIGLPKKVVFEYNKGVVTCYPNKKEWVVEPNGKKKIIHVVGEGDRNDVTKFKARFYLKLAIVGVLRDDTATNYKPSPDRVPGEHEQQ